MVEHEQMRPVSVPVSEFGGIIWKVENLFFHQVGQIWSYRALVKAFESSRRDLAIEKGFRACFFLIKGKIWIVHTVWS